MIFCRENASRKQLYRFIAYEIFVSCWLRLFTSHLLFSGYVRIGIRKRESGADEKRMTNREEKEKEMKSEASIERRKLGSVE